MFAIEKAMATCDVADVENNATANSWQPCNQSLETDHPLINHTTVQTSTFHETFEPLFDIDETVSSDDPQPTRDPTTSIADHVESFPEATSEGSTHISHPQVTACDQHVVASGNISLPSSPRPSAAVVGIQNVPKYPASAITAQGAFTAAKPRWSLQSPPHMSDNADNDGYIELTMSSKPQHAPPSKSRSVNDGMGVQSANIPRPQNSQPSRSGSTGETARPLPTGVVLIGNPGVGKSALFNALGGQFSSGISVVSGLTKDISKKDVYNENHGHFQLIDTPGIYDTSEGAVENLRFHLDRLNDALGDTRRKYVVFFVVALRSGRMDIGDRTLIKAVLSAMTKGPKVAFIFTQIASHEVRLVHDQSALFTILNTIGLAESPFVDLKRHLVLPHHSNAGFKEEEISNIQDFVYSSTPKKVQVMNIVNTLLRDYFSGSNQQGKR